MSLNCGSIGKTKDPLDCYFPQKLGDKARKSGDTQVVAKEILRDHAITMVTLLTRWMFDAGLPFNCVNYTDTFQLLLRS